VRQQHRLRARLLNRQLVYESTQVPLVAARLRVVVELKFKGTDLNSYRGQTVLEFLSANAFSDHPAMALTTNGSQCIVWRIADGAFVSYSCQSMASGLEIVASFLRDECSPEVVVPNDFVARVHSDAVEPLKRLKALGNHAGESALLSQLDSVLPFLDPEDRAETFCELISTWQVASEQAAPHSGGEWRSMFA